MMMLILISTIILGYRLCRRAPESRLGMIFASILEALAYLQCSLQAFVTSGVHWNSQESQSWLFGNPVQAGAPIYGDFIESGGGARGPRPVAH